MNMKDTPRHLLVLSGLVAAAVLGGCSAQPGSAADGKTKEPVKVQAVAKAEQPAKPAEPAKPGGVEEKTDAYTFTYRYPAQAAALPGLKEWLENDLKTSRTEMADMAKEGRADAKKNDYPFHPYEIVQEWSVVTDLPDWLSLSEEIYTFTGGAHGNTGFAAALWDKRVNRLRRPLSLFLSDAALEKAVQPAMCDALDRERSKRREEKVVRNQDDWMTACIGLKDTTVILGSAGHKAFDRIGFLIGPYAAGPYAEGTYEVTLPVTQAVIATVKPEFRSAFAIGR